MSPAPSVASKIHADDVSLLMVLLDTSPFFWSTAAANSSSFSFSSFLSHILAFLNSMHLINQLNHVVVIATRFNSCQYVYDSSAMTNRISDDGLPAVYSKLLHNLEEFVDNDENMCNYDFQTGLTSSLLSGSLSMALCYIQWVFRSCPLQPQPRILCVQGSPDGLNSSYRFMCHWSPAFCLPATGFLYNGRCISEAATSGWTISISFIWALISTCSQMQMIFATDLYSHGVLQLPKPIGVDFRASCFCHKNTIDMGYICSVCLSIFCEHHKKCSTCRSVSVSPKQT